MDSCEREPKRSRLLECFEAPNAQDKGHAAGNEDGTADADERRYGSKEGSEARNNSHHPVGTRTKPCTKFFSTSGCPYGEGCHFLHYVSGGINALGTTITAGIVSSKLGGALVHEVPKLYAAGLESSSGGYKTRLCNRYNTPEGCRFGKNCHFGHGQSELRLPSRSQAGHTSGHHVHGYVEATPLGASGAFGVMSTTKLSIKAAFVGAIIGKAGANVKEISQLTGAKVFIREHDTDPTLRNVEMVGYLEQIEVASEMVRQILQHIPQAAPAKAAALPSNFKTKLCQKFSAGTCTFGDRCHFAHGEDELRAAEG